MLSVVCYLTNVLSAVLHDTRAERCVLPDKCAERCVLPGKRAERCVLPDKPRDKPRDKRAERCVLPDKRAERCVSACSGLAWFAGPLLELHAEQAGNDFVFWCFLLALLPEIIVLLLLNMQSSSCAVGVHAFIYSTLHSIQNKDRDHRPPPSEQAEHPSYSYQAEQQFVPLVYMFFYL